MISPLVALLFLSALAAPAFAAPATAGSSSEPRPTTPEELARFMRVEHARWERVVKTTGLSPR